MLLRAVQSLFRARAISMNSGSSLLQGRARASSASAGMTQRASSSQTPQLVCVPSAAAAQLLCAPALPRRQQAESSSGMANAGTMASMRGWHRARFSARAAATEVQASTSDSSSRSSGVTSQLVLVTGAYVLPHPEKMAKGGEDWFFISESMRAMGVADGVGGWAEVGVDAGAYARQLMGYAKDHADKVTAASSADYKNLCNSLNPNCSNSGKVDVTSDSKAVQLQQSILEKAYYKTDVRGSSTACVLVIAGDRVLASNLGDSGFLLVRDGQVAFHSPQQQHDFNFPFQIGSVDSMSDPPQSSQRFELLVQPGDVLILGTDGLWDNCFDEEIMSVVRYCQDVNMAMDKTAQVLAHYARHRASDPKFASPFAYAAFQAGFAYMGGKMDDITVVIARVAPASELADNPMPGQGGSNHTLPGSKL